MGEKRENGCALSIGKRWITHKQISFVNLPDLVYSVGKLDLPKKSANDYLTATMISSPEKNVVPKFTAENGFTCLESKSIAMRRIRSEGNTSELAVRKFLWHLGVRYRVNDPRLPGKPDIVITKAKLIIFIDGGFWHGHNWRLNKSRLKTNRDYWIPKIEANIQRDQITNARLQDSGWTVLRFWEHEVKKEFGNCIYKILTYINLDYYSAQEHDFETDEKQILI